MFQGGGPAPVGESPTSTAEQAPIVDAQAAGRDLLRSAAKWIAGAFGGVGVVLLAGTQWAPLGELSRGSDRLTAAVTGLVVAALGLAAVVALTTWVLLPRAVTTDELTAWARNRTALGRLRPRGQVVRWFERNPSQLHGAESIATIEARLSDTSDTETQQRWREAAEQINLVAAYRLHLAHAVAAFTMLIPAGLLVLVGFVTFTWAANPPTQRPASLRNADLRGANLSGAVLDGTDLTGADLSGASLEGATTAGATLTDVVWNDTTCPDGTNSRASRRTNTAGSETCIHHLLHSP